MTEQNNQTDPEFIAAQLKKPSGDFAEEVGMKMNRVNKPLFDLTVETMQLQGTERLLEIGFGTGAFFKDLFKYADDLKVSGIDFSEEMVKLAQSNNKKVIDEGLLNVKWGESDDLPFSDSTFDKVYCNMVVYFWDQPGKHLSEVHRVLKPGGKFYTGIRSRESMLVFPFVEFGFNLYAAEEWKEILSENGFIVTNEQVSLDPELDFEGNTLQLESHCIVAAKNG
ncbi:class I SAM-dependent methyltransferase [Balneolaceae bacterium YR4-1]|uniref:Class I SAM-dependent methyltransferase n=1 Tax=Halalkalibaculum roseum TaxID=2709311 RepID=A0A6M1SXJ6_9BACT|nr:class I SAM-dependent methyltransferase [Halalkalibaculum roseum]NGP75854.1 class I SAM-dependent methyltransferase [Halalkalibaculum roseum]